MIDIFKIGGTITLDGADKAVKAIESVATKAGYAAKKIAKIGTAAIGAASAATVALTKFAVQEYAEYEQLVGGVETLFKDASDAVQKYADNAYKTAGLSANEYMETVTSFSASLLQSLDGDTTAAAEKANTAITDMSDNANKMGTDMAMIQNAYSGFAKQNYTMLDNLKLGYGGTKEEMQRLIDDANALNKAQGKNTNYTIESYADIIDAIHDVQTEMGITGTTAKEASTTIQGSVASAKSAWKNLLVGIADENQDFDQLIENFVDSVETAADNILPRVERSLDGILELVKVASEKIVPRVISTIAEKAPDLIEAGAEIVLALGDGIVNNLDGILSAVNKTITRIVPKFSKAFSDLVPKIAEAAKKIIKQIDGVAFSVAGLYGAFKSLTKGNWIGVGIGLATAAYGLMKKGIEKTQEAVYNLTNEQKEWLKSCNEAVDATNDAKESRDDGIISIMKETDKTKDLWKELHTLVDENGNVLGSNHDRVDYILGELNNALGTEYERNGDIIGQYQTMQEEIDKLIEKKKAEMLLENGMQAYTQALQNRDSLLAGISVAEQKLANAQKAYEDTVKTYGVNVAKTLELDEAVEKAQAEYDAAVAAAGEAEKTIQNFEAAQEEFEKGNNKSAAAILTGDTVYQWENYDDLSKLSAEKIQELIDDRDKQAAVVATYEKMLNAGMEGFTQEGLEQYKEKLSDLNSMLFEANGVKKGGNDFAKETGNAIVRAMDETMKKGTATANPGYTPSAQAVALHNARFPESTTNETTVNINVHADTDDLGTIIARKINEVVAEAFQANGNYHRAGRSSYAVK